MLQLFWLCKRVPLHVSQKNCNNEDLTVGIEINKHYSYKSITVLNLIYNFNFEYNVIEVCYYQLQRTLTIVYIEQTANFNEHFKDHQ